MSKKRKRNQSRREPSNRIPKLESESWVHFRAKGNSERLVRFFFSESGEVVCPEAHPNSMISYRARSRVSGKQKILAQTPGSHFDLRSYIQDHHDVIAGIDTNNFELHGRHISICSCFCSEAVLKSRPDGIYFHQGPAFIIEGVRSGLNPEVIGWHLFIRYVLPLLSLSEGHHVALAVDSELGCHPQINSREQPYYETHFLPPNIQLVYASSDTGDDLLNQLIRQCDRASRTIYKLLQDKQLDLPSSLGGKTRNFHGYAYVNIEKSPYQITAEADLH